MACSCSTNKQVQVKRVIKNENYTKPNNNKKIGGRRIIRRSK